MEKALIILFTRYPVQGQVKTRLIPVLGAEGAAQLHKQMTEFALQEALATGHQVQVHYMGTDEKSMQEWLGDDIIYVPQGEGDLGQRMHAAFQHAFATVAPDAKVLLMGSDCPDNRRDNLLHALALLDTVSCVLGPAADGGYYLMALRGAESVAKNSFFADIAWGTDVVFSQTITKVAEYATVSCLQDVDFAEDIPAKISVVIPTFQEEQRIAKAIASAKVGFDVEIIVADGGSSDKTCAVAQRMGAKVFVCPQEQRGRAQQMNYGAQQAAGDIVLFLHADSLLPLQWDREVRQVVKQSTDPILGYFRFAVSGDFWGKSCLTWGTNVRAERFLKPYGDQGLFLRKTDFFALGAYADVPILEDVYLVNAMKKKGKLCALSLPMLTSGRRWQERGFLRVTLFNQVVLIAAAFGVDLKKIRKAYREGRLGALWE